MAHAHGSLHSVNGKRVQPAVHEEPRSLDDLAELTVEELSGLYAGGKPPQLGVLAGVTRGRLLAIAGLDTLPLFGSLLSSAVRKISGMRLMPWRGKTFAAPAEHHRTSGRNRWFELEALPFDAHVEKSALDHEPTLVLKYDRPENPAPVRALFDELREIGRGLYLGPVYVRGPNGPRVLGWWGCVKE
ncbi:MAG: hypothetical protein ACXWUG_15000 [Polyangiales bacterium]